MNGALFVVLAAFLAVASAALTITCPSPTAVAVNAGSTIAAKATLTSTAAYSAVYVNWRLMSGSKKLASVATTTALAKNVAKTVQKTMRIPTTLTTGTYTLYVIVRKTNSAGAVIASKTSCVKVPVKGASNDKMLMSHNAVRAHKYIKSIGLTWDPYAAQVAYNYAKKCTWGHNANRATEYNTLFSPTGTYKLGENIAATTGFATDTAAMFKMWYTNECKTFVNSKCPAVTKTNVGGIGHFTQIIWNNTRSVGCAMYHCRTGSPFKGFTNWTNVVCDYFQSGNYLGQKPHNKLTCNADMCNAPLPIAILHAAVDEENESPIASSSDDSAGDDSDNSTWIIFGIVVGCAVLAVALLVVVVLVVMHRNREKEEIAQRYMVVDSR